ncbi:MAG: hypothetical protein GY938_32035 [Ketobacter sp.]|nr:hypothetical protein [Ketobacter sp.]
MPRELIRLSDPNANRLIKQYSRDIKALSNRALSGDIDEQTFRTELNRITAAAFAMAFLLGDGDQQNEAGKAALKRALQQERNSINVLTSDIFDGRFSARSADDVSPGLPEQTAKRGRDKLGNRLILWAFTLAGIYHMGQEFAAPRFGEERRYEWGLGNTEEHCRTCLALDGVVLTASEWRIIGHKPQGRSLECGGWNCDCERTETDKPSQGFESVRV